ncbi:hypothetical protein GCM10007989_36940 [Devosia pacifica]|uniref:Alpha-L-rhamnosidase six-hairpin glycosidase domain-containing protein n=1 Tax=Devosia pacifica TaxID=1335967 RepID=A0A918SEL9_9HYPH|nr:hypothetical protein [Devosia pacifica]GHA37715.1 hypothetical protein GCM10007989_36940 [Devosia pacifica]
MADQRQDGAVPHVCPDPGATTIWERWDAVQADGTIYDPQMNSYNHYAYGAV